MNPFPVTNLDPTEVDIPSQDLSKHEKEARVVTPRKSARSSFVRAQAFCRMNKEEQLSFIAQRFQQLDSQELINIFKAVYGRPADKGRPRSRR